MVKIFRRIENCIVIVIPACRKAGEAEDVLFRLPSQHSQSHYSKRQAVKALLPS